MSADLVERPAPRRSWPGYVGVALLIFALWRGSVSETWDVWCNVSAALGIVGVGSWAAGRGAEIRRRARSRSARYGGHTLVSGGLLIAVLALLNFLGVRHNRSFDLTESGLFTLSPETNRVLTSLKQDVLLRAFFPASRRAQASDILRRYAEGSRHLRYELIDPDQEPEQAQKYGVTAYGTVVAEVEGAPSGAKPIRIEAEQSGTRGLVLSEEKLTNALLKVARGGTKTVYFLQGHGEADVTSTRRDGYSRLAAALEAQAFSVKPLVLARKAQVPADCTELVVAGPASEPLPDEMNAINAYLEHGGKILVMVDPMPGAGLARFLDGWGMQVGQDIVVDPGNAGRSYGAGPAMPLVADYNQQHPITRGFRLMTFFPLSRSVTPEQKPGDAQAEPLAFTGPDSFAEPHTGAPSHVKYDPKHDRKGPITVAAASTRQTMAGPQARMVVIGSSNFVSNSFFDRGGNGDFLLNCANWLGEGDQFIAIRPKPRQDHRVELTDRQARGIFWLTVIIMPSLPLVVGGVVFWRRRPS